MSETATVDVRSTIFKEIEKTQEKNIFFKIN